MTDSRIQINLPAAAGHFEGGLLTHAYRSIWMFRRSFVSTFKCQ